MSDLVQQLSMISDKQASLDQIINTFLDEADYSLITKTMNKIHEDISLLNSLDQSVPIEKRLNSLEKILTQVQMIILQRALSPDVKVSFWSKSPLLIQQSCLQDDDDDFEVLLPENVTSSLPTSDCESLNIPGGSAMICYTYTNSTKPGKEIDTFI